MGFDLSAVTAYINETANLNDIFKRSMYGNDTAPYLTQIQGVKATNKLPNVNHEQNVLVDATNELTDSDFNGDVDVTQTELITGKVAYWNKFRLDDLEGFFTQMYLPRGANYDLAETEIVLARLLQDDIPNVVKKQVELLTWQGDTDGSAPVNLANGFNKLTAGVTPVSGGAITASNALTFVDGLIDTAMEDADWASKLGETGRAYIFTGHDVIRKYEQQYRSDYTAAPYNGRFEKIMPDGTVVQMIGCSGLTGRSEINLVDSQIFVQGSDLLSDQDNIEMGMNQFNEYVWVKVKFRLGFAVRDLTDKSILKHTETGS